MLARHCIVVNGSKVYYWIRNPHIEQTMVFVHGFRGNHKGLTEVSDYFNNYCTILLDLPGYGKSDSFTKQSHTIKNYARFLSEFVTALNLNKINLVGHSYGASIAILYASMYPKTLNHLILISPAIPFQSASRTLASAHLKISRALPRRWRKAWLTSPLIEVFSSWLMIKTVSRRRRLELLHTGIRNAKEQRPRVLLESLDSFLNTPFFRYAQEITAPTFILTGETDIIAPLKTQLLLSQYMQQVKIQLMPKVGHLAPLERPGTVGRIIEDAIAHESTSTPTHVHYSDINDLIIAPKQPKKFSQHKYY